MERATRPKLPVPLPLRGDQYGSFAHQTVVERLPRILERVLEENAFPDAVTAGLRKLLDEIPDGAIRMLRDESAPDAAEWIGYVAPHLEKDWLQAPWFFAETYFYRRILEATGYFQAGNADYGQTAGVDPFAPHKAQSLEASWERLEKLAERVQAWRGSGWENVGLDTFLALALWGNQGDLSMWPGGAGEMPTHDSAAAAQEHVLVDDSEVVDEYLARQQAQAGPLRVDVLADNAGFELVSDLALIDYLLDSGRAGLVVMHLKMHPTFVSDVIRRDVQQTIAEMSAADAAALQAWGRRLQQYVQQGHLQMTADPFWTSPLPGWELPQSLRSSLSAAHLVISKGDAHYRRLLGDRHWAYTAPFAQIVAYFPTALLALRTLKSEVASGLSPEQVTRLTESYPDWLTSGDWGVIQFALHNQ
ncbi:MAG TPA: damage-control phosphatase ARMT1 family protein [Candidatus Sulfomarinibacteraceae bacterium]|nr:damage-control phosphatase ARMT1 family protein [Candidatus Sulfomarinibacteraceae bacterium]